MAMGALLDEGLYSAFAREQHWSIGQQTAAASECVGIYSAQHPPPNIFATISWRMPMGAIDRHNDTSFYRLFSSRTSSLLPGIHSYGYWGLRGQDELPSYFPRMTTLYFTESVSCESEPALRFDSLQAQLRAAGHGPRMTFRHWQGMDNTAPVCRCRIPFTPPRFR